MNWKFEEQLWNAGYNLVAGVDEAGRGALAGPVVASVVILPKTNYPYDDSKVLTLKQREQFSREIKRRALAWATGFASAEEIDALNILKATHLAAKRALDQLGMVPHALVTDYLKLDYANPVLAPPKADSLSSQVAAASILAKTTRDQIMIKLDAKYPAYGFSKHKGYGSAVHLEALDQHGPCVEHRKTFKPVAQGRLFG